MNPELRAELIARMDADQAVRERVAATWPGGALIDTTDPLFVRWRRVDHDNTAWLETVVDSHGWPGSGLVGEDGAHAAWLLAQHADDSPEFQQRCLTLMTMAVESGDAAPANLAYLVDRVATHEGQPQVYGTQHEWRDGAFRPIAVVDPERVDARRRAVGLGPLAEHTTEINSS